MPSDDEVIREAVGEDARDVARLIRASKYDAMPWLAVPHTLAEDDAWVAETLLPGHEVRVVENRHGVLEAVIACSPGWVDQLYVASAAQGRGLGSRLLRDAQDAASGSLQLWVFQRNTRARAFYEDHGFVAVRETDGDNEEHEPDVLYRWSR